LTNNLRKKSDTQMAQVTMKTFPDPFEDKTQEKTFQDQSPLAVILNDFQNVNLIPK